MEEFPAFKENHVQRFLRTSYHRLVQSYPTVWWVVQSIVPVSSGYLLSSGVLYGNPLLVVAGAILLVMVILLIWAVVCSMRKATYDRGLRIHALVQERARLDEQIIAQFEALGSNAKTDNDSKIGS